MALPPLLLLAGCLQVYASIEQLLLTQEAQQLPLQQQQKQHGRESLSPQQLLRSVSILAGLKYTQPVQLSAWLEAAAGGQHSPDKPVQLTATQQPAAAAAGAGAAAIVAAGSVSHRQLLTSLKMWELAALVANLARAGARPSNVWLLAFMQVGGVLHVMVNACIDARLHVLGWVVGGLGPWVVCCHHWRLPAVRHVSGVHPTPRQQITSLPACVCVHVRVCDINRWPSRGCHLLTCRTWLSCCLALLSWE